MKRMAIIVLITTFCCIFIYVVLVFYYQMTYPNNVRHYCADRRKYIQSVWRLGDLHNAVWTCEDMNVATGRVYVSRYICVDKWGHVFHVVYADTDDLIIRTMATVVTGRHFVVWSDGENGINEYGYGDDINSCRS